jgi:hypothetical protein
MTVVAEVRLERREYFSVQLDTRKFLPPVEMTIASNRSF